MTVDREALRARLQALGFDDVRFASAAAGVNQRLRPWLDAGHQADMAWLGRTAEKRVDAERVLPGVRTVIALGVNYWAGGQGPEGRSQRPEARGQRSEVRGQKSEDGGQKFGAELVMPEVSIQTPKSKFQNPNWARYAQYSDYHDTMKPALVAAGRVLEELAGVGGTDYRYYVDTGPVLERGWAERAGVGFVGKNTMLISRRHGNWLLLAAILTRAEIEPDAPLALKSQSARIQTQTSLAGESPNPQLSSPEPPALEIQNPNSKLQNTFGFCGKCTRCLDACPTQAFPQAGVLDARRCISYQTIENRGVIPRELRAGIRNRIYGCDVCLEVCPWNRFAQAGRRMLLTVRGEIAELSLREVLELTPERFAEVFRRTPIKRIKLAGLLRNACVVAGNQRPEARSQKSEVSGENEVLLGPLVRLAGHVSPVVRAHAVWAVFRLGAGERLAGVRASETDPEVLAEYTAEEG